MREIRIHDTLTNSLRPLEPRDPGKAGIYACGPTVYGRIHVGNARPFVVFSLLKRFLEHEGYDAKLVINVTDVNDKIYAAAEDRGIASAELAREMTDAYIADTDGLGLGRPDAEPKAAETVGPIVDLIQALVDQGAAYPAGEGDVYFRVGAFDEYGKLSNRALEDMQQGEDDADRAGIKEAPQDFALWKGQKPGEDTSWASPWGEGRPGWHIECSAMAEEILGVDFDIHGGGADLIFPHHENEIAQTEAARHTRLARIWMHNGMVRLEGEKMAKSVGNIRLLHEALYAVGRDTLVMYFVSGHYRQPLVYTQEALADAAGSIERVRDFARRLDTGGETPDVAGDYEERFYAALADDFNTPAARAVLFDWISEANRRIDEGESVGHGPLPEMLRVLGLENLLDADEKPDDHALRLLDERENARKSKDFAIADARRDELAERGWVVRDTSAGPQLVRKR
ncbi:MAG: cysteinyl-tRNA synthetase [Thermoleophilaceae bacterium]|nr:cysteinyl-tRNA synthetase [Thermoleophilaceae bacterium]